MHAARTIAVTVLAVGLLIVSSGAASAATQRTTVKNLRGPLVNAWFSDLDSTGCIETDTFVSANGGTDQLLPGRGTTTGVGAVSIYRYDMCTDTTLLQAVGWTDALGPADFQVSRQLDSASLDTVIGVANIDTGESFNVAVDVNWVGVTDIARDDVNSNDNYGPGCHVLNRWKGSGREANASGSVSDGVTNFTPTATSLAEIGFVIDGFEVIGCA